MNKFNIYIGDTEQAAKLKRYLKDKGYTFTVYSANTVNTKSESEAKAISKFCAATGKSRFRRTDEELSLGLTVEQAIEQRLNPPAIPSVVHAQGEAIPISPEEEMFGEGLEQ